jgi:hypothetical protein
VLEVNGIGSGEASIEGSGAGSVVSSDESLDLDFRLDGVGWVIEREGGVIVLEVGRMGDKEEASCPGSFRLCPAG